MAATKVTFADKAANGTVTSSDINSLKNAANGGIDDAAAALALAGAAQPKETGKGLSSNDYTTAEKQKLAGLDSNHFRGNFTSVNGLPTGNAGDYAYVGGAGTDEVQYIWDATDNKWVPSQVAATAETPASIKSKYESNPDTNAYTNTEKAKLALQSGTNTGDETQSSIITKVGIGTAAFRPVSDTEKSTWNGKQPAGSYATTQQLSDGLANTLQTTDFTDIAFGTTVTWDQQSKNFPLAKTTATASFTLSLANVKSGSQSTFKVNMNTANDIIVTLSGTGLTFKAGNTGLTNFTLAVGVGRAYFIQFINDNGTVEVSVLDNNSPAKVPACYVTTASQSVAASTETIATFTSELQDNANIFDLANPTRFTVPGTGLKRVKVAVQVNWPSAAAGLRRVTLGVNGTFSGATIGDNVSAASLAYRHMYTGTVWCNGGDYVEVRLFNNTAALTPSVFADVEIQNA